MIWRRPIRVVGVGSPNGDDALGWETVRRLQRMKQWPADIEFHTVEGGQRLLDVLDGKGSLLLIDALAPVGKAGTIHRFDWPDDRVKVLRPGSTHDLRPAEALQLAATLGMLPDRVVICGIEGERFDPIPELSPVIALAVAELARRIVLELELLQLEGSCHHA